MSLCDDTKVANHIVWSGFSKVVPGFLKLTRNKAGYTNLLGLWQFFLKSFHNLILILQPHCIFFPTRVNSMKQCVGSNPTKIRGSH